MNDEIKQFLIDQNTKEGYGTTDLDLRETLTEGKEVFSKKNSGSRWWDTWQHIVEINGRYISYEWAHANRDESIFDLGWEFDWDSIVEVWPKTIETTKYFDTPEKDAPAVDKYKQDKNYIAFLEHALHQFISGDGDLLDEVELEKFLTARGTTYEQTFPY
jgi:hypothetical protein